MTEPSLQPQLTMIKAFAIMTTVWCVGYGCYAVFYHLSIELWPRVIETIQAGNNDIKLSFSAITDAATIINATREFDKWGDIGFFI